VETAAKANHSGPFCTMCRHGIMFLRHAQMRGKNPKDCLNMVWKFDFKAVKDLEL
jgi:hypothetical protein